MTQSSGESGGPRTNEPIYSRGGADRRSNRGDIDGGRMRGPIQYNEDLWPDIEQQVKEYGALRADALAAMFGGPEARQEVLLACRISDCIDVENTLFELNPLIQWVGRVNNASSRKA